MHPSRYDPLDSSTWKNRFTKSGLQWKGLAYSGRIVVLSVVFIATGLLSAVFFIALNPSIKTAIFFLLLIVMFILAVKYAFVQANIFVRTFYQLASDYKTSRLLKDKLFTPPPLPKFLERLAEFRFVILAKVEDLDIEHFTRWFGGPARLIIYDGVAVYIERGNTFSRVLGPGFPLPVLEKHERIKAIVDLRPVVKEGVMEAWTKDGVKVKADVQAEVQILSSDEAKLRSVVLEEGQEATNLVYPFDADNVKKIVEKVAVGIDGEELQEKVWHDAAMGTITGGVKAHISRYSLNELITRDENSPQLLSFDTSNELAGKIEDGLKKNNIVQLLDLQITGFSPVDDDIKNKLEEYWEEKEKQAETIRKGRAEAQNIRIKQNAYTLAYQNFLNERIDQIRETSQDNDDADKDIESSTEVAVMLLNQVFEKSSKDPMMGTIVAREILKTLDILRKQLNS